MTAIVPPSSDERDALKRLNQMLRQALSQSDQQVRELSSQLNIERAALQNMSRDLARIAYLRITEGKDSAMKALDDFIANKVTVMAPSDKSKVH